MNGNDDDLMMRVLHGRNAERHHWDDYYREFHASVPAATPQNCGALRTPGGKTSYEMLISELPSTARTVMDVGCGDGFLLNAIHEKSPEATLFGIDLSAQELEVARERLAGARIGELVEGSALDLPFKSASFDVALSHMVLMLIPEAEIVLREIHRVLKAGGTLAFVVGDPGSTNEANGDLFKRVNDAVRKFHPGFSPLNPADPRIFSANGIDEILRDVGFTGWWQTQFVTAAKLNDAELFQQLRRRYYVGSFSGDVLSSIKELTQAVAGGGFLYTEALRLVVAHR